MPKNTLSIVITFCDNKDILNNAQMSLLHRTTLKDSKLFVDIVLSKLIFVATCTRRSRAFIKS